MRFTPNCQDWLLRWVMAGALIVAVSGCDSQPGTTPAMSIQGPRYGSALEESQPQKPRFNLHPVVEVQTSAGKFTLQLDAENAPLTVDNFLTYLETGQYDGTVFHQVYDGFIVLGGGYDKNLQPRPTRPPVRNEAHNGLRNRRATVAMARQADAIDSAASQFFINLADNASLDHAGDEPEQYGYCVFGEVIQGMEVVEKMAKAPIRSTDSFSNVPVDPVVIESMRRIK